MKVIFTHTNIVAKEWKGLADFYIEVFGCKPKPPERDLTSEWLDRLTAIDGAHIRGIDLIAPGSTPPVQRSRSLSIPGTETIL